MFAFDKRMIGNGVYLFRREVAKQMPCRPENLNLSLVSKAFVELELGLVAEWVLDYSSRHRTWCGITRSVLIQDKLLADEYPLERSMSVWMLNIVINKMVETGFLTITGPKHWWQIFSRQPVLICPTPEMVAFILAHQVVNSSLGE